MKFVLSKGRVSFLGPKVDEQTAAKIQAKITELSYPTGSFYLLVCLSTIIAAYGLLANSTAAIIGAMLIAPLMGPIFGMAMSLYSGNNTLLKNSALAELLGIILSVGIGLLIGLIPLRPEFGSEILARTQPTIYDLLIALASGFAGAYSLVNEKLSSTITGVAIATALVPPLTTSGLCLATGNWSLALGAFLLFAANLLAIEIAAATVFVFTGVVKLEKVSLNRGSLISKFGLRFVVLILVAIFMTQTLVDIIESRRLSEQIRATMTSQVNAVAGARLSEVHFQQLEDSLQVIAVALTPREFETEAIMKMETTLQQDLHRPVRLIVRSLISKDADKSGPVFISEAERLQRAKVIDENEFLSRVSKTLTEQFKLIPGTQMTDLYNFANAGETTVTAVVRTPSPVTPEQVTKLEAALNQELQTQSIKLVVRSLQTKDADAQRYLYEKKSKTEPLIGEDLEFHQALGKALEEGLTGVLHGASLLEFRYVQQVDNLLVLATVRTPNTLNPNQVKQMEDSLKATIDPTVKLVVRSVVGAETSTEGYLGAFDDTVFNVGEDIEVE